MTCLSEDAAALGVEVVRLLGVCRLFGSFKSLTRTLSSKDENALRKSKD